eukprot:TRINITY_DN995_c1_g1_i4.p1 TRINITY_DN995_c1_g1~~TRINITY_DN995_c1_g1_i4.p1  ORF type:complete len:628 (-),score=130.94 TRINITY_DN995_c1_g1_i4:683-2566(-)
MFKKKFFGGGSKSSSTPTAPTPAPAPAVSTSSSTSSSSTSKAPPKTPTNTGSSSLKPSSTTQKPSSAGGRRVSKEQQQEPTQPPTPKHENQVFANATQHYTTAPSTVPQSVVSNPVGMSSHNQPTSSATQPDPTSDNRPQNRVMKLTKQFSSRFNMSQGRIEKLPPFKDVPASERMSLFQKKMKQCCIVFDFTDPQSDLPGKEIKRVMLTELVEFVNTTKSPFPEMVYEDFVQMISANLFRALPPRPDEKSENLDPEEDEPILEAAWPHLQITYEFLLRFIESPHSDVNTSKKYIDSKFVLQVLDLFGSDDPRERDYLKTVLHRIYGKFLTHRAYIRKVINNIFYHYVYETERHNGIAELLEILGSIINGFALPLKEEHKQFLGKALLPLHKPRLFTVYSQQLTYCVTQFLEKDQKLSEMVIKSLLKFWPVTYSAKEVVFLSELEEVLELTDAKTFSLMAKDLFHQLAKCLGSPNFQVAEKALFLWNNEYIVSLIAENRKVILPLIFGSLFKNSKSHWNPSIHSLTYNVLKVFMEMDSALFDECSNKYKAEQAKIRADDAKRKKAWAKIEEDAAKNTVSGVSHVSKGYTRLAPVAAPQSSAYDSFQKSSTEEEPEEIDRILKQVCIL